MMGFLRVVAILVVFGGVAIAQQKPLPPPTAAQKAEIERLAKRAITKSQANDHEGAIKDLLEAHAIHPVAANVLLSNVGHEFKQLRKPYEALKYYCMYLDKEPTGSAASYVKAETEVLKKELKLEGEACAAKVEVKPDPPKTDLPKTDPPKTDPGLTGTKNFDRPASKPGGTLRIAGLGVGAVGAAVLGTGLVYGIKAYQNSNKITKGPPVDPNCTDPDPLKCRIGWDPPNEELGWAGLKKLDADGTRYEKLQIAFTVTGGAVLLGGAALYMLGRSKGSSGEMRLAPTVAPGTGGLTLVGSF